MSELRQATRNRKREYWQKHINNWLASSVSQKKYCEQQNISYPCFTWWRTRGLKDKGKPKKIAFIPAVIKEQAPAVPQLHTQIQVVFPNQAKLVLPSNLPIGHLVSIIKSLGGLS